MTLDKWINSQVASALNSGGWDEWNPARSELKARGHAFRTLAKKSGVTEQSLRSYYRGMRVGRGDTAQKISKATGGAVTALELMGIK
jgi:transcriptional regulator with XRE-family HTH domain